MPATVSAGGQDQHQEPVADRKLDDFFDHASSLKTSRGASVATAFAASYFTLAGLCLSFSCLTLAKVSAGFANASDWQPSQQINTG